MCLGIPGLIIEVKGEVAKVDVAGARKDVSLALIEGVGVNDYVIVHAGFAIEKLDEDRARKTLELILTAAKASAE